MTTGGWAKGKQRNWKHSGAKRRPTGRPWSTLINELNCPPRVHSSGLSALRYSIDWVHVSVKRSNYRWGESKIVDFRERASPSFSTKLSQAHETRTQNIRSSLACLIDRVYFLNFFNTRDCQILAELSLQYR